jgi:hypothetical protein
MLRRHGGDFHHCVVFGFCLGWRDTADGQQQAAVVEPVDPDQSGKLDLLEGIR